jgi:hypothetical protein
VGRTSDDTLDFDADGVADMNDSCFEVSRGTADANDDGCPDRPARLVDTDGDTIPDSHDKCPTVHRGPTDVDADGCPDAAAPPPPPPPPPAATPVVRCVVPNLRGKTVAQSRRLLTARRCRLGRVSRAYSAKVRAGRVIRQSRRAGVRLPRSTRVNVTLSRGKRKK